MWQVISVTFCIFAMAETDVIDNIFHILERNNVNLGAYDAQVNIGQIPDITKMTDVDEKASSSVLQVVESIRFLFPTGILSIPPLDPYRNKNLKPLVLTIPYSNLISGQINIQDLRVEGAKNFNINSLETRLDTLRTDFDITIPSLHGYVSLHLDVNLGGVLPMQLDAKVNFHIKRISVVGAVGAAEVDQDGRKIYQVQTTQGKLHADELHVSLEGVRKHSIQDILNFLKKLIILDNVSVADAAKEHLDLYVTREVIKEVNKLFREFTVEQIKAYLLS